MTKPKTQTIPGLPADPLLASDFLRAVRAGRAALGIPTVDEKGIADLARKTANQMPSLSPEARLVDRNALLAIFDEFNDLSERLSAEHAVVKGKLKSRARHGEARKAYQRGNPR